MHRKPVVLLDAFLTLAPLAAHDRLGDSSESSPSFKELGLL